MNRLGLKETALAVGLSLFSTQCPSKSPDHIAAECNKRAARIAQIVYEAQVVELGRSGPHVPHEVIIMFAGLAADEAEGAELKKCVPAGGIEKMDGQKPRKK